MKTNGSCIMLLAALAYVIAKGLAAVGEEQRRTR